MVDMPFGMPRAARASALLGADDLARHVGVAVAVEDPASIVREAGPIAGQGA
jgi:hypothetical protein